MHTRFSSLALVLAVGLASPLTLAQPSSEEQLLKEKEAARLAEEKLRTQNQFAEKELEEAKKKAALNQGPIGQPGVKPALTFDALVKDLGKVTDDAPVQITFKFTNTSDKPVKVTNVSGSCGCTVPSKLAKELYAPGETGEVTATYNPANRRGKEVKHVYVDTDFAPSPRIDLTFNVDTLARIMVDPQNLFLGEVRKGEARSQKVSITGREPGFDVTSVSFSDNTTNFTAKRLEKTEVTEADGTKLTKIEYQLDMAPNLPLNNYRTALVVSTNDTKRPNVTVNVQASVVGDLRVTPDRVWLVANQAGQPWTRDIRIDNRRAEPFWITGVEAVDIPKDLKVVYDIVPAPGATSNAGYILKISGITPPASGILTGKFILRTSHPDFASIDLPMQGNIQLQPPVPPQQ